MKMSCLGNSDGHRVQFNLSPGVDGAPGVPLGGGPLGGGPLGPGPGL